MEALAEIISDFFNSIGQTLPSRDFCGTAALPPETGHWLARLARPAVLRLITSSPPIRLIIVVQMVTSILMES